MKNIIKNTSIVVGFLSLTGCYPLVTNMGGSPEGNATTSLFDELLINLPQLKPTVRFNNNSNYPIVYNYYTTLAKAEDAMYFTNRTNKCHKKTKKMCITFAVDDSFLNNISYQEAIFLALKHPCRFAVRELKEDFSDQVKEIKNENKSYRDLGRSIRLTNNKDLQEYFGCNTANKVEKDIYLDVVKNLEQLGGFFGPWTEERYKALQDAVIKTYSIKTSNQP